jgi:hypothetical protein
MTTIINTPPAGESADSGLGLVLGIILALIFIALFFVYGLPAIQANNAQPEASNINVDVQLPEVTMDSAPVVTP